MAGPARIFAAASVALVMLGAGCSDEVEAPSRGTRPIPHPEQPFPVTLTDDEGVETSLEEPPQRVVTFAPSHTEIVLALGLGDRLVGVSGPDDDYPPGAADIPAIATATGTEPDIDEVTSRRPEVLLSGASGGDWKERLRELGIPVFTTLAVSFEDALADIGTLGRLLGAQVEANELISEVALEFGEIQEGLLDDESVSCFLDLGDLRTVGPGSLEFDLLTKAGCRPVTSRATEPYPRWTRAQLERAEPSVYLLAGGRRSAAPSGGAVHQIDNALISRPGPRMVQGIRELADALHAAK